MPDFSIALTGLQANSTALNTIGNNLANLNTTAYKGQTTTFEDLFYQQVGSSNSNDPIQVGVGTKVSGTVSNFAPGSILPAAGQPTNMALSGSGFFVVQQGSVQSLTRAGNFQLDAVGNLTTIDGESVMGFPAVNGKVGLSSTLTPLALPVGETESALATQNVNLTVNLNSAAATTSQFSSPVTVYDTLGAKHVATVTYTKTSATTWTYDVALPPGTATGAATANTGTLTFDSTGKLVTPAANIANVGFTGMADGASDMSFSLNLYNAANVPTFGQSASANNTGETTQDGYASGTYVGFAVDASGTVSATFSNNQSVNVGQVAVASIANTNGLTRTGNNNYQTSEASGVATIGVAGVGGRALITDDALEQSNVDISTEFSNLIIAQRAFEANSKTVTTFDTVTQDAISMIR